MYIYLYVYMCLYILNIYIMYRYVCMHLHYLQGIFDWMVLTEDGRLFGGFTLRVSRSLVPASQRADYDRYIGVKVYEPGT